MEKYIFLGLAAAIIAAPTVLWRIYKLQRRSEAMKECLSKPFVCSYCGHRFFAQQRLVNMVGDKKAFLKCPACKKRSVCGRPYDLDDEA